MIIYTDIENLTCKRFIHDIVLIWIRVIEGYGLDIEYIQGDENIVAGASSRLTINGN